MSDPLNPPPPLAYRVLAGLFGLLLGLSTLVSAVLVMFLVSKLGEGSDGIDPVLLASVGLFAPMTFMLAGSTSSMALFALTGRRGPLIHQGSLRALIVTFGCVLSVMFVGSILGGDWSEAFQVLCLAVEMLALFLGGLVFGNRSEST